MIRVSTRSARLGATLVLSLLLLAPSASAVPPQGGEANDAIVEFVESDNNKDYDPKTESEGSEWEYDPAEVDLTSGESDSGTNFQGARILEGNVEVVMESGPFVGDSEDTESTRYANWQGSTLFFGAQDAETANKVDGIAEFYWFESSIPRGSDFYVMQIKIKSSPDTWEDWGVADEANFWDDLQFWNEINPAQALDVFMEPGGEHGSLRWDWCVPFDTYEYEPLKVMQLQESYGAGYSLNGDVGVEGSAKTQFKEGGVVADLSGNADIQSKGYINSDFKVQSQYTVTLYRWQMLVQSGGTTIHYKTVVLPNEVDEESSKDSAYHEYFVVIQATRGVPVHIDEINIGASFREYNTWWFDGYQDVSVGIGDIWITPPTGICLPGDVAPAGTCPSQGVCGDAKPKCSNNQWLCPVLDTFEAEEELTCDGLDNDCDGVADEFLDRDCETACGTGFEVCSAGVWGNCSAKAPQPEICGNFADDDCNGAVDDGCEPDKPDDTDDTSDTGDDTGDTGDETGDTGVDPGDTGVDTGDPGDDTTDGPDDTSGATDVPDDVDDTKDGATDGSTDGVDTGADDDWFGRGDGGPGDELDDDGKNDLGVGDDGTTGSGSGSSGCAGGGGSAPVWPLLLLALALPAVLRRR